MARQLRGNAPEVWDALVEEARELRVELAHVRGQLVVVGAEAEGTLNLSGGLIERRVADAHKEGELPLKDTGLRSGGERETRAEAAAAGEHVRGRAYSWAARSRAARRVTVPTRGSDDMKEAIPIGAMTMKTPRSSTSSWRSGKGKAT